MSVQANPSENRTGSYILCREAVPYHTDEVVGTQGPISPITGDMDTHTHIHMHTHIHIYTHVRMHTYTLNTHSTLKQLDCEQPKFTSGQPSLSVSSPQ